MLQDRLCFVLLDGLWHHVQNVVHDSRVKLKVVVRLHALLRNRFGDTFTVAPLKLSSEEVAQPALKKGNNARHKEQPNALSRSPEATTRALADWTSIETIVDQAF